MYQESIIAVRKVYKSMRQNFWYCQRDTLCITVVCTYIFMTLCKIPRCIQREDSCIKNALQLVIYHIRNAQDYHIPLTIFYIRVSRFKKNNRTNFCDSFLTNRPKLFPLDLCASQQLSNLFQHQHFVLKTSEPIE